MREEQTCGWDAPARNTTPQEFMASSAERGILVHHGRWNENFIQLRLFFFTTVTNTPQRICFLPIVPRERNVRSPGQETHMITRKEFEGRMRIAMKEFIGIQWKDPLGLQPRVDTMKNASEDLRLIMEQRSMIRNFQGQSFLS